jgi:hypothetical protein
MIAIWGAIVLGLLATVGTPGCKAVGGTDGAFAQAAAPLADVLASDLETYARLEPDPAVASRVDAQVFVFRSAIARGDRPAAAAVWLGAGGLGDTFRAYVASDPRISDAVVGGRESRASRLNDAAVLEWMLKSPAERSENP